MNKLKFNLVLPGLLLFSLASIQVHGQGNIVSCANIEDAQERLACYDSAAGNTSNLPVVRLPRSSQQPAATDSSANNDSTPQVRQDEFGLELKQERQRDTGPDSRSYRVLAARHNDFTGWTIEFEGGGVWKQVGTDDYKIEVGERYTVNRATFNSFVLSNSDNNRKIRITRVE
jgi:hypothetical protein